MPVIIVYLLLINCVFPISTVSQIRAQEKSWSVRRVELKKYAYSDKNEHQVSIKTSPRQGQNLKLISVILSYLWRTYSPHWYGLFEKLVTHAYFINVSGMGIVAAFYVSELSHAKYRAAFSGFLMLYASVGIVVISILQIFFTWQQTALICCIFFTILLILCIFYLPESPVWLAKFRSDLDGAKRTLRFLISDDEVSEWKKL